jgi:hypothetical protein
MMQNGKTRIRKNSDAKLAIEGYHRKNTKNLMAYVGGVEELRHKEDFPHHLDSLNLFKTNE